MDLIEEAESLLLHQFANSSKLKGLIRSLAKPFQEALDHLEKLRYSLYIEQAEGETLDIIGKIVGQERKSMSDEDYRPWLKVGVLLNTNAGTTENVLRIAYILYGNELKFSFEEDKGYTLFTMFAAPKHTNKWVMDAILKKALPLSVRMDSKISYLPQSPPKSERDLNINAKTTTKKPFQLDTTAFSESFFSDFLENTDE
jgi:hypothetical protein